jgi:hypothetical protein
LVHSTIGVEIQPLAEMLEDLLREASEAGGEVYLAEAALGPNDDREALRTEYEHRYQRAVAAVSETKGPPQFEGPGQEANQALLSHCERAASWPIPTGFIYVGLIYLDASCAVVGGAAPHAPPQAIETLLPPPD